MNKEDLPTRWKQRIKDYLISKGEGHRIELNSSDFNLKQLVSLEFDDGSYAEFNYPLLIEDPDDVEIGIFTEHCGYHIFNLNSVEVKLRPRHQEYEPNSDMCPHFPYTTTTRQ